ncbi:hypothetical protein L1987_51372 [Smallanthus sonchifolius]|uniref:Uncharacterized protein n=1 Tax=Smallanthus sonchifolius TaxID=185202 RepID=A0ACB9EQW0_9ASTR|nr:hypothetical protein L1987_51372 [Smallanthus sonchifolius]
MIGQKAQRRERATMAPPMMGIPLEKNDEGFRLIGMVMGRDGVDTVVDGVNGDGGSASFYRFTGAIACWTVDTLAYRDGDATVNALVLVNVTC